jgi:hypothetical protein
MVQTVVTRLANSNCLCSHCTYCFEPLRFFGVGWLFSSQWVCAGGTSGCMWQGVIAACLPLSVPSCVTADYASDNKGDVIPYLLSSITAMWLMPQVMCCRANTRSRVVTHSSSSSIGNLSSSSISSSVLFEAHLLEAHLLDSRCC